MNRAKALTIADRIMTRIETDKAIHKGAIADEIQAGDAIKETIFIPASAMISNDDIADVRPEDFGARAIWVTSDVEVPDGLMWVELTSAKDTA